MSIAAVLLFGSLARADQSEKSDTDLLMVTAGDTTRHLSIGNLSMFMYPRRRLNQDARNGDLFACHLVREAKAIYDPKDYLSKLKDAFHLKSSYQPEISNAVDLGWFIVKFGDQINSALRAKRTFWCVRTVLIAQSAESGNPVFAPNVLADRTASRFAREILIKRHDRWNDNDLRRYLRLFLEETKPTEPFHSRANRAEYFERFTSTANKVALQTLQQEARSSAGYE